MGRGCIFAALACGVLTGCATPLPIVDYASTQERAQGPYARYQPQNNFSDLPKAVEEFEAYYFLYQHTSDQLNLRKQSAGEVGFFSSVLAILGGAAKSPGAVVTGGLGTVGSSIYSERYRLDVQAANYDQAARAMRCLSLETRDLDAAALPAAQFTAVGQPSLDALPEVLRVARDAFIEVRDRLRSLQIKITLGSPDLGKLKEVAQAKRDSVTPKAIAPAAALAALAVTASNEKIELYRGRVKACTALLGS